MWDTGVSHVPVHASAFGTRFPQVWDTAEGLGKALAAEIWMNPNGLGCGSNSGAVTERESLPVLCPTTFL